ncbi:MAG: hypothetical protein M3032_06745 [Verrucomicrobiota bacterium]|nr:hypothetical protein [Verrucomicrobiota bacterium]
MSKKSLKTYADVRAAFENGRVLKASRSELEEYLAATACEKTDDPAQRAQLCETGSALRQLIVTRRGEELRRPSSLAVFAVILLGAGLLWCGAQTYLSRRDYAATTTASDSSMAQYSASFAAEGLQTDARTTLTISELAERAPSIRSGTVQAWWAGEQARQVQALERQAKRQTLAGDRDGAARSARRADAIRNSIPSLAASERTSPR